MLSTDDETVGELLERLLTSAVHQGAKSLHLTRDEVVTLRSHMSGMDACTATMSPWAASFLFMGVPVTITDASTQMAVY